MTSRAKRSRSAAGLGVSVGSRGAPAAKKTTPPVAPRSLTSASAGGAGASGGSGFWKTLGAGAQTVGKGLLKYGPQAARAFEESAPALARGAVNTVREFRGQPKSPLDDYGPPQSHLYGGPVNHAMEMMQGLGTGARLSHAAFAGAVHGSQAYPSQHSIMGSSNGAIFGSHLQAMRHGFLEDHDDGTAKFLAGMAAGGTARQSAAQAGLTQMGRAMYEGHSVGFANRVSGATGIPAKSLSILGNPGMRGAMAGAGESNGHTGHLQSHLSGIVGAGGARVAEASQQLPPSIRPQMGLQQKSGGGRIGE